MAQRANHFLFYVQGTYGNKQTAKMMSEHPSGLFVCTDSPSIADVIVFTGGEDINPKLYNEQDAYSQYVNDERDRKDILVAKTSNQKIKIGICRGAQFLNCVLNGGRLWQDCDNHENGPHHIKDYLEDRVLMVNSVHHQMMIPGHDAIVIAGAEVSEYKYGYETTWKRPMKATKIDPDLIDAEVIWYKKTQCLCVQFHPEYAHRETREYFYGLIDRLIIGQSLQKKIA